MRTSASAAAAMRAYEEIKRRIIDSEYPPGAKLSEMQIADELKLGRSPIRTAFARLQNEGWVTVSPQSGTYVKVLSEAEIEEIYEIRLLLEAHVARRAAQNISPESLGHLLREFQRRIPREGKRLNEQTFNELNELDTQFHSAIYQAGGNSLITTILMNLLEKVVWVKKVAPSSPARMQQWSVELRGILKALERRDAEAAATRMLEHVRQAAESGTERRRPSRAVRSARS